MRDGVIMFKFILLYLFYLSFTCALKKEIYDEPEYKLLPPVYRMENIDECIKLNDIFCEMEIELKPIDENSKIWKLMNKTIDSFKFIPRNILRRALCVPRELQEQEKEMSKYVLSKIEYEVKDLNLTAGLKKIGCNRDPTFTTLDYTLIIMTVLYIVLLIWSTVDDFLVRKRDKKILNKEKKEDEKKTPKTTSLFHSFSFISNLEKFRRTPTNPDYLRLKSMQGLKCFITFLIIVGHSFYSSFYSYLLNPDAIEQHIGMYPFQMFANMGMYQVQGFLLMSGWLLALQVLTINDLFKGYQLSHTALLYLNRYLRLFPVIAVMIAFHTSSIPLFFLQYAPLASKLVERTDNCKRNWWKTILFIHNNDYAYKMCESGTWYIGVDSQMYFISIFVMFIILKYKLGLKGLFKVMCLCCMAYGCLIYYFNVGFFCRITPSRLQFGQAELSFEFLLLYISTYSSASSFFIGIMFGWVYYENKNVDYNLSKWWNIPWFLSAFGLPWLVLHISMYEFGGAVSAVLGALVKPIFTFGFGILILGMANNLGGPIKKFFENKYFELLANITFSLYIFHFDIVFPRSIFAKKPIFLTKRYIFMNAGIDLITSTLLGFTMYMILELPFSNLIKIFMKNLMDKEKKQLEEKKKKHL
ncbi:unnamed protein product [Brassicogethes aeneus]|uniref:Acyltransferase 3 domain-containing protein n=1 Tax=Brassicogethes aeneus TaxID=1431903 RepID=A0A9P0AWK2_BRAAE|nr:unnamed protein product [Brassicogethes aeneus]